MNETAFVDRREGDWKTLSFLCDKAETRLGALTPNEFEEMIRLYRRASTDLAVVRTRSTNLQLADYLNALVGRAYGILYRAPRGSFVEAIKQGLVTAVRTVRRRKAFIAFSGALFFGAAFFSYGILKLVPETRETLIMPGMERAFEDWKKPFDERTGGESFAMTGFYLSNNPRAAIMSGAVAAATFGVGTGYVMFSNGALLGALAHELEPHGQTMRMLIWVSPHGVPEISGFIIAGGAGFVLGWALINPGRRRRGDALREAAVDATVLLVTSIGMMFIAAPIEGFFSFNPNIPNSAKLLFTGVSAVAWGLFWVGFAREPSEAKTTQG